MNNNNLIKRYENLLNYDKNLDVSCEIPIDNVSNKSEEEEKVVSIQRTEFWNELGNLLKADSKQYDEIEPIINEILNKYPNNLDEITQKMIIEVDKMKKEYLQRFDDELHKSAKMEIESIKMQLVQFMKQHRHALEKPTKIKNLPTIWPQFEEIKERINDLTKLKNQYEEYLEQLSIKKDFEVV